MVVELLWYGAKVRDQAYQCARAMGSSVPGWSFRTLQKARRKEERMACGQKPIDNGSAFQYPDFTASGIIAQEWDCWTDLVSPGLLENITIAVLGFIFWPMIGSLGLGPHSPQGDSVFAHKNEYLNCATT